MNNLKIVLVGDAEVGKTWLVSRAKELYATLHDYYSLMKEPFDYDWFTLRPFLKHALAT